MKTSQNKLQKLNTELTQLPENAQSFIAGGLQATRFKTWTAHNDHQDMDGYAPDEHAY